MGEYVLTRLPDADGKIIYDIKNDDEYDFTLVSWDYEALEEIASRLDVGESCVICID